MTWETGRYINGTTVWPRNEYREHYCKECKILFVSQYIVPACPKCCCPQQVVLAKNSKEALALKEAINRYSMVAGMRTLKGKRGMVFITRDVDGDPIPEGLGELTLVLGLDAIKDVIRLVYEEAKKDEEEGKLGRQSVYVINIRGIYDDVGSEENQPPSKEELKSLELLEERNGK